MLVCTRLAYCSRVVTCLLFLCCADETASVGSSSGVGSSTGPAVDKLRWEQAYTGPDLSAALKQLQPAHRYLLRVRAINEIGASQWSPTLAAQTAAAAPCQPMRLSAAAEGSSSSMAVSWQPPEVDNGAPVTAYHLEMQAIAGAGGGWGSVWQGGKLSHTVGGLLPGREYSWRVRAVNACGVGPWSEAVTAKTAPAVPGAPSKPSVSKVMATSAKVKWSIPLEDHGEKVEQYIVHLRQLRGGPAGDGSGSDGESGGAWIEAYGGPRFDTTVTKLQPGSSYEVRVAAANKVGLGPWSPVVELATPLRPPPPPAELAAVPDEAQVGNVAVSWQQAEPGADSAAAVSVIVEAVGPGSKEAAGRATVHVADGSSAVLQGLRPGVTYQIRARSVGAGSTGHSAWCEVVSVSLPAPLVSVDEGSGVEGVLAEVGKRPGKGKGGKGAATKAAGKGDGAESGELQPRKGGRGKKGIIDVPQVTPKKPVKPKHPLRRMWNKVRKLPYFNLVLFTLILVAVAFFIWRQKVKQPNE